MMHGKWITWRICDGYALGMNGEAQRFWTLLPPTVSMEFRCADHTGWSSHWGANDWRSGICIQRRRPGKKGDETYGSIGVEAFQGQQTDVQKAGQTVQHIYRVSWNHTDLLGTVVTIQVTLLACMAQTVHCHQYHNSLPQDRRQC